MKKVYFSLLMVFMAGTVLAQSTTQPGQSNSSTKNDQTKSSITPSNVADSYAIVSNQSNAKSVEELPGYPVLQNTGNEEQDKLHFEAAKEKWMRDHKDIYDAFIESEKNKKENISTDKPKN